MIKINENNEYEISIKDYCFTLNAMFNDVPIDFLISLYELFIPYPNNKHSTSVVIAENDENGIIFVFSRLPLSEELYIIHSHDYKNIIKMEISHRDLALSLINNIKNQYSLFLNQYKNDESKIKFLLNYNKLIELLEF